jgi:hydrogenase maturation protein HypF
LILNRDLKTENAPETYAIQVKGLIQGVGFRPYIYKLATEYQFKGFVENRNDGVLIVANVSQNKIRQFIRLIKKNAPVASEIRSIRYSLVPNQIFSDFRILKSSNFSNEITDVSPDIAVCELCLEELRNHSWRHHYPFINCTNCGPRFSIISDLPYDRHQTSMSEFKMCDKCEKEYKDVSDRRFHAQPIACADCGPTYQLITPDKNISDLDQILTYTCNIIDNGGIIAMKGTGGFHLCCDALNEKAVCRLRNSKNRDSKPFAVMFQNVDELKKYAVVNKKENQSLLDWRRPIVLLKQKKSLAYSVNNGLISIGAMLPYMPMHYLLFEKLKSKVIVLTSGNISDEPIVTDNDNALNSLSMANAHLIYNRSIQNRVDDSVVRIINHSTRLIRRSRGYVPSPINLRLNADKIFAAGAELNNCFCIGKGNQAIISQHIGDLKKIETYDFYNEQFNKYKKLFRFEPELAVHDLHPDYLSTSFVKKMGIPAIAVQHHFAHIASCMAEHDLDEKVIGVAFDGTGFGDDGNIWGGEFLLCDLNNYTRIKHLEYLPLPGGDKAVENPWMMGISYLYAIYGNEACPIAEQLFKSIDPWKIEMVLKNIQNKINSPLTSGMGRLFDAFAAITGICTEASYHAEAPVRLESYIRPRLNDSYSFSIENEISFNSAFVEVLNDIRKKVSLYYIVTKFHNTVIFAVRDALIKIRSEFDLNKVILSGGVFQNSYLSSKLENMLKKNKFKVYIHKKVPCNDGGISLGQLAIAAKRRELSCV